MMRKYLVFGAALLGLLTSGCVTRTAYPAKQGKAWIVDGTVFGTSMYNCEAPNGKPVCYEVIQEGAE